MTKILVATMKQEMKDLKEYLKETLADIKDVQEKTLAQTTRTNGRVTKLEGEMVNQKRKSIGIWISNHPFKFLVFVLIFASVVISDIRHPILDLLIRIF